ncbi:MAG: hypothetical protein JWP69_523 [Flaviaesturariibacter sp.]|nr:hypothetical protein [Flaviaesturariibacter sp.]
MKKVLFLWATLIACFSSFAQTDSLRAKLDSVFQYVNKSLIPTGYLKEYGAELTPLHWLNGVLTDSNMVGNLDALRLAYTDLSTAKIQSSLSAMPALTIVNDSIDKLRKGVAAPVAVLYGSYASLRDDALSQNLFTVSGEQIYDVSGRNQSPYLTNTLFAAASTRQRFRDTVRLTFSPALYYTNTGLTLSALWVDFKDGNGYQSVPSGGVVTKVYVDSSSLKPVDFKAQLSSGAYLYCHSTLEVKVTPSGSSSRYAGSDPYAREVIISPGSGETWAPATLQIRYSQNNSTRTGSTPRLLKPLIYVEGYDVEDDYDIMDLIRNETIDKGEWVNLALIPNGYDLMYNLDDVSGYDLVFVNYNTLRSFTENTLMLQRVIEWIKTDKTAGGSSAKNVVIGTSAGGVLSRYTLARMTKQISTASTDTRLLITHDSPHQGANVPLAFQHFLFDLGECKVLGNKIKDNLEDLRKFYALNLAPATAELLKARVVDESGTVALNTFLVGDNSAYQQMVTFSSTDNQPDYRFIATAQGSQCGVPVLSANGLLLASQDDDFSVFRPTFVYLPTPVKTKWYLKTNLYALPGSGNVSQIEYFKYSRRISFWGVGFGTKTLKEENRSNPSGFTEWDAAPGSTQSIGDRTGGSLTAGLEKTEMHWLIAPYINLKAGLQLQVHQDLFSFVPTVSGLDAPSGTPLNQPYIFPITGTAGTRTQKYIGQQAFNKGGVTYYNQNHTDFTARNAEWIYKEMQDLSTADLGCSTECGNTIYKVEGAGIICSTGVYKVVIGGVDFNGTVNWSASPTGIVSLSCTTCPSPTLTKLTTGNVTLTATITVCGTPETFSKTITVSGTPTISAGSMSLQYWNGNSTDYNEVCVSQTTYTDLQFSNANSVTWSRIAASPSNTNWSQSGDNINFYFWQAGQTAVFSVSATNSCGTTTNEFGFKGITCGGGGGCELYRVSPNPAKGSLKVSTINIPPPCEYRMAKTKDGKTKALTIAEVRLYDNAGTLKQVRKVKNAKEVTINLAGFKPGVYHVEVSDGSYTEKQKIIIQ